MKRTEIDAKYKWDLSKIYPSITKIDEDLAKIPEYIKKIEKYRGKLMSSSETLLSFIKLTREAEEIIEKMDLYLYLLNNVEMDNKEGKIYSDKVDNIMVKYNEATSFVIPELLQKDYADMKLLTKDNKELAVLDKWFQDIYRTKEHALSEKEEILLSNSGMLAANFAKCNRFLNDKEIDYGEILVGSEKVKLLASNISKYALDSDRNVRKQTFENENAALKRHIDSLATNYIGFLKYTEADSKFHGYSSALERSFNEDDIDIKAYTTLMDSVKKAQKSYANYIKLFKTALGITDLQPYDLNAPIIKEANDNYSIEEAKEIILDVFSVLGSKYQEILKYAFDNGCIDYLPCENKQTGWSSIYCPYTEPFVFANYDGKVVDISSLCHELGHFCNQYLLVKNQLPEYVHNTIFCAEIASLTNEILFSKLYAKKCDDKLVKANLLYNYVMKFTANFFGASRQALFEEKAHNLANKGEALSSEVLCDLWLEAKEEVFGDIVKGYSPYNWAAIPHFFMRKGYYVYNYATSIVAASNVAYKILNGEEGFLEKYLEFLKMGSKVKPLEAIKSLGIDMLDSKNYDIALKMYDESVQELIKMFEDGEVK